MILISHQITSCLLFFVLFKVTEDLNADPEADSDHFMIVIIESLSLLGKIPEAIEVLQLSSLSLLLITQVSVVG